MRRTLPWALLPTLAACSHSLDGPTPEATSLDPNMVCVEQLTTDVTLHGDGLSPITERTLVEGPRNVLPRLALNKSLALDGTAATGEVLIPDDPEDPAASRVRWVSQQEMHFDIFPELGLTPGVWGMTVDNPTGKRAFTANMLLAVPPPRLDRLEEDLTCTDDGPRRVTLHGENFLVDGTSVPTVTVGAMTFTPTYNSGDCVALPGPRPGVLECTAMTIEVPEGTAAGRYAVVLTNPAPAACATSESMTLHIMPEPQLLDIEPQAICLSQGGVSFTVSGQGFLTVDGALPTVLFSDGSADVYTATPAQAGDMTGCITYPGPTETVQVCTGFTISLPQDSAATGLIHLATRVENPEPVGCESDELNVTNFPPPVVSAPTNAARATICQGGGNLTVSGTNLRSGAAVRVGGVAATTVSASGCNADGLCSGLAATFGILPRSLVTSSPVDLIVENADGCEASQPTAVEVDAGLLLLYADPPVIYDGFANTIVVYATGASSANIASVELISSNASDAPIVLCDDATATPCASDLARPGATFNGSGTFTVTAPAGLLTGLMGNPTDLTFDLRVETASAACSSTLPQALRAVSVPTVVSMTTSPSGGQVGTDTPVAVTLPGGNSFIAYPTAYLSGGPLRAVTLNDAQNLTAIAPSTFALSSACQADSACRFEDLDLTVVNPNGQVLVTDAAFRLSKDPAPRIDTITPGQIPASGTTTIRVGGVNFQADNPGSPAGANNATLSFACRTSGGTATTAPSVTVTSVSATEVQASLIPVSADVYCIVEVTNPRDGAKASYSALVFGNSSGNIPLARRASVTMNDERRRHGMTAASATTAARFLYVAGGDPGADASALATVELSARAPTGEPGAFVRGRYSLANPRTHLGLVQVDRALYAIGGAGTNGTPVATVERAVVLHPDERVAVNIDTFDFGTPTNPGLGAGTWIYRVAMVFAANDPVNPCGESLPSEPFTLRLPDVTDGLAMSIGWVAPSLTGTMQNRVLGGYRVYRSTAADVGLAEVKWLNDVNGASTLTYTDDGGAVGTATAITNCTDMSAPSPEVLPAVGMLPAELGQTSRWVSAGVPQLVTARRGAGVAAVVGKGTNAGKVLVFAVSGRGATVSPPKQGGLDDYEVLALPVSAASNPTVWENGLAFVAAAALTGNSTGSCNSSHVARTDAGLVLFQAENSSDTGEPADYQITDDKQYLVLGPGRRLATGADDGDNDSWLIGTGGTLGSHVSDCTSADSSSGYGNIGANRTIFMFGGTKSQTAIRAQVWSIVSNAWEFGGFNNNGSSMLTPGRRYHGSVLDGAFIYLSGGEDLTTVLDTIDFGIW